MQSGTKIGHYEVLSLLGKGGMGEVWKATDTKLGREVAIKTLPEEFSQDSDRLVRFDREAKLLASLNHPNIAAIYGLEEHNGKRFLVLELVEGPTLEDRIKQGAIPIEEALKLALQIAEALEAAHDKGVIHRDLKPGNVKVTPEGKVKVLDFGLAKAFEGDQADVSVSNSPTLSMAATQQGIILGTAAYMSPEQAKGRPANRSSDIWAFGALLFEMLTGRPAFEGEDISEILASVIKGTTDLSLLPIDLHPTLRRVVSRCLEKDTKKRFRDIGDVHFELSEALSTSRGVLVHSDAEVVQSTQRSNFKWILAATLLGALIAGIAVWNVRPESSGLLTRFTHILPDDQRFTSMGRPVIAISPDGSRIVYVANEQLYLRPVGTLEGRPIPGTEEDPTAPFFSPDGNWVGYWSRVDAQVKKIALSGGTPVSLSEARNPNGRPFWGPDQNILWGQGEGIMTVSANGGTPEVLIASSPGEGNLGEPQLLPDGESVVYRMGDSSGGQVVVQSLRSDSRSVLLEGVSPRYVSTGHLVYGVEDALLAVPFGLSTLQIVGSPVSLVEGVRGGPQQYALSDSGTLIYVPGGTGAGSALGLLDRQGNLESLPAPPRNYFHPRFSPDDSRIAVEVRSENGVDIWIYEIEDDLLTQLTFEGGERPVWSRDGAAITFLRDGALWTVPSDFTGMPEMLPGTEVPGNRGPDDWSPDGILLFASPSGIHAWRAEEAGGPAQVIIPPPAEGLGVGQADFSPDGNWIVYTSEDEPGQPRLFATPFPADAGSRQRITTEGGVAAVWIRDGGELIFENGDRVQVMEIVTEPRLVRSNPTSFFGQDLPINLDPFRVRNYDATANGQRLLTPLVAAPSTSNIEASQINVVLNFVEELKERVPIP